jgi:hypothetical protein
VQTIKRIALISSTCLLLTGVLSAQETSPFTFSIGAGFTEPVGTTGRALDTGWNVQALGGYNFIPYLGLTLRFNFNDMGVNTATLDNLGYPGGSVRVWDFTLDPVVHLSPHRPFDVYLTGGGGIYHRYQDFTAPSAAVVGGCSPFFGCFNSVVGVNEVLASYSVTKPGIDAGMGIAFGSRWHVKFFGEARYNRMFIGNYHTDFVPVTFGFRW